MTPEPLTIIAPSRARGGSRTAEDATPPTARLLRPPMTRHGEAPPSAWDVRSPAPAGQLAGGLPWS